MAPVDAIRAFQITVSLLVAEQAVCRAMCRSVPLCAPCVAVCTGCLLEDPAYSTTGIQTPYQVKCHHQL